MLSFSLPLSPTAHSLHLSAFQHAHKYWDFGMWTLWSQYSTNELLLHAHLGKKAVGCTHLPYAYRKPLEKTNALSISFSKSLSDQLLRCCASLERVCFVAVVELSSSKLVAFLLRRIIGDGVLKARLLSISAILIVRSFASKWLAQAAQAQASASVVRWCDCSQQSQVLQAQAFEYDASEIK